ncbi:hypothetical protein KSS87_016844 [Heliosperma pusillum]|nr:hypothetical protein KSS87_016844 [Heliosperma pusillum]
MNYISILHNKLEHLHTHHNSPQKPLNHPITNLSIKSFISSLFHSIVLHAKPCWLHICYFLVITVLGYLTLKLPKPRTGFIPTDFDLFFTSASATTVASLSTVEMEVFSNTQLIIMVTLIFFGGEIFISFLSLQLKRSKLFISSPLTNNHTISCIIDQEQSIELGSVTIEKHVESDHDETRLLQNSIKSLGYIVMGYILVAHVLGTSLVSMYISLTKNAKSVLENKGLVLLTFHVFTTVSTFANCGFIPTNENMIVFRNNPGLLLILTSLGLVGGTLYPPCLRLIIWVMKRVSKRNEYTYLLENYAKLNYGHLMSSKECWLLVATVFGFLTLQFATFCVMEWSSGVMEGMSSYEKVVGSVFQTVNVRHAGESIVDLSVVSSAILVIFIVMMYFPPYTCFLPIGYEQREEASQSMKSRKRHKKNIIIQNLIFSHLSYLTIFVILICFTESKSLKEDPLNFNVLNIVFEVIR